MMACHLETLLNEDCMNYLFTLFNTLRSATIPSVWSRGTFITIAFVYIK